MYLFEFLLNKIIYQNLYEIVLLIIFARDHIIYFLSRNKICWDDTNDHSKKKKKKTSQALTLSYEKTLKLRKTLMGRQISMISFSEYNEPDNWLV